MQEIEKAILPYRASVKMQSHGAGVPYCRQKSNFLSVDYGPDSLQSQQMSQSSIAGQLRDGYKNKFNGKLCKDWGSYTNVKSKFGAKQVIVDGLNGTAEFVGDARGDVNATSVDCAKGKVTAKFKLTNTTSLTSLFYGLYPNSLNPTTGPGANWTQTYTWYEKFDCKCCATLLVSAY